MEEVKRIKIKVDKQPQNKVISKEYVENIIKEKIQWLDEQMEKTGERLIYSNYRYTKSILEEILERINR